MVMMVAMVVCMCAGKLSNINAWLGTCGTVGAGGGGGGDDDDDGVVVVAMVVVVGGIWFTRNARMMSSTCLRLLRSRFRLCTSTGTTTSSCRSRSPLRLRE